MNLGALGPRREQGRATLIGCVNWSVRSRVVTRNRRLGSSMLAASVAHQREPAGVAYDGTNIGVANNTAGTVSKINPG